MVTLCKQCGQPLREDARFCNNCGALSPLRPQGATEQQGRGYPPQQAAPPASPSQSRSSQNEPPAWMEQLEREARTRRPASHGTTSEGPGANASPANPRRPGAGSRSPQERRDPQTPEERRERFADVSTNAIPASGQPPAAQAQRELRVKVWDDVETMPFTPERGVQSPELPNTPSALATSTPETLAGSPTLHQALPQPEVEELPTSKLETLPTANPDLQIQRSSTPRPSRSSQVPGRNDQVWPSAIPQPFPEPGQRAQPPSPSFSPQQNNQLNFGEPSGQPFPSGPGNQHSFPGQAPSAPTYQGPPPASPSAFSAHSGYQGLPAGPAPTIPSQPGSGAPGSYQGPPPASSIGQSGFQGSPSTFPAGQGGFQGPPPTFSAGQGGFQGSGQRPPQAFAESPGAFSPSPVSTPSGVRQAFNSPSVARPRRSRKPLVVTVLILLLVLLVGGTATWVVMAHPFTPSAVTQPQQPFSDATLGLSLAYPAGWQQQVDHAQGTASFFDANHTDQLNITVISADQDPAQALPKQAAKLGIVNFKASGSQTFAGSTWQQGSGNVVRQGANYTETLLITQHSGHLVVIAQLAPPQTYTEEDQSAFSAIHASFKFL